MRRPQEHYPERRDVDRMHMLNGLAGAACGIRHCTFHDNASERVADEDDGPLSRIFQLFRSISVARAESTPPHQTHLAVRHQLGDQRVRMLQNAVRRGLAEHGRYVCVVAVRQDSGILQIRRQEIGVPEPHLL